MKTNHDAYVISTLKDQINQQQVYDWLSTEAYWYPSGLDYAVFNRAFHHSFCIGTTYNGVQVAFGRLITDYATFGYLADVYVVEEHRGRGIAVKMLETLLSLPWVQGLRRINLRTKDAFGLYGRFGFRRPLHPERLMGRAKLTAQTAGDVNEGFTTISGAYTITTNKVHMDTTAIHGWLSKNTYWAENIPATTFETSFFNSFCIAVLHDGQQLAFARLVTDYAMIGWLADVYVHEPLRGQGWGKKMLHHLFSLEWTRALSINLATRDAQTLYEKFQFEPCNPDRLMEMTRPGIYTHPAQ